jgi:hypothetical protein
MPDAPAPKARAKSVNREVSRNLASQCAGIAESPHLATTNCPAAAPIVGVAAQIHHRQDCLFEHTGVRHGPEGAQRVPDVAADRDASASWPRHAPDPIARVAAAQAGSSGDQSIFRLRNGGGQHAASRAQSSIVSAPGNHDQQRALVLGHAPPRSLDLIDRYGDINEQKCRVRSIYRSALGRIWNRRSDERRRSGRRP